MNKDGERITKLEIINGKYIVYNITKTTYETFDDAMKCIKNDIPDETWDIDEEI